MRETRMATKTPTRPPTKTLLKMNRYDVAADGSVKIDDSKAFSVMINPSEITEESSIEYSRQKTFGQAGSEVKFSAIRPDKVGFSIVVDGTVAAPTSNSGAGVKSVKEQLADLNAVVYEYVGKNHEPSRVRLLWGGIIFFGRMSSMTKQYTLFMADGAPLRAKVELQFLGSMSKSEEQLVSNRSSPDLTHIVTVKEGDTLPLLCNGIYGDPSYYPEVAKFNDLMDFRELVPGRRLIFPALE